VVKILIFPSDKMRKKVSFEVIPQFVLFI